MTAYGIDPVDPVNPVKFIFGCGLAAALGSSVANFFPRVNGYTVCHIIPRQSRGLRGVARIVG